MIKDFFFITLVSTLCHGNFGREFRFDYKFSIKADGWLQLHQGPATWMEARLRCHAEGSVLASPLTKKLQSAIIDLVAQVRRSGPATIFTGIHASFSKGDYFSIEGVPLLKLPITWAPGEPNNYANSKSCLVMETQFNGIMADVKCSDVFPYVCYKKKTRLVLTECGTHDFRCNSAEDSHILRDLFAKNLNGVIFSQDSEVAAIGFHDWGERGYWMIIHGETLKEAGFDWFGKQQPNNLTNMRTGDDRQFCGSILRSGNLNEDVIEISTSVQLVQWVHTLHMREETGQPAVPRIRRLLGSYSRPCSSGLE